MPKVQFNDKQSVTLPAVVITKMCSAHAPGAIRREIPGYITAPNSTFFYHYRSASFETDHGDKENESDEQYNLFPVVLDSRGCPWPPAVAYIASLLRAQPIPSMTTFHGVAGDIGHFLAFLEERAIDFSDFPLNKLKRPTYRFKGYLVLKIHARDIAPSTARRRMYTVIRFYRWLVDEGFLVPSYAPWQEQLKYLSFKNSQGFSISKKIKSTDVTIKAPQQQNPFEETIMDGGRLRPLPANEQIWLLKTLAHFKNIEMTLIHVFMLITGARIQTTLTLRLRHFKKEISNDLTEVRLPVGPGTGIDTKNDKNITLFIPAFLYDRIRIYIASPRAQTRRSRATGDEEDQYVFVTQQGSPYYDGSERTAAFDPSFSLHHRKRGQTFRIYIRDKILPYIRTHFNKDFHYKVHDLRATYGMNMCDSLLTFVENGTIPLSRSRAILASRMGHDSSNTTDLYLNYRRNLAVVRAAVDDHEKYLKELIQMAWEGSFDAD